MLFVLLTCFIVSSIVTLRSSYPSPCPNPHIKFSCLFPHPKPYTIKNHTHQVKGYFWPQAPLFKSVKWCLTKDLQKKAKKQPKGSRVSLHENVTVHLQPQAKRGSIAFLYQGTLILNFIALNQLALCKTTKKD